MRTDNTHRIPQLVNHDQQYHLNQSQGLNPLILNKWDMSDPSAIEQLQDLIFSDGSGADFVAKCQCEELEGNNKIGMMCPVCETVVQPIDLLNGNNLICKNWLSAPEELIHGWLTPKVYLMLSSWLSYDKGRRGSKRNYLDDILDIDAELPHELQGFIEGRGFTYLYENFDQIIDYFCFDHPVISKKPDTAPMRLCLTLYRDQLFCRYVPVLNSAINPMVSSEGTGASKRKYSDMTADFVLRAAISLSELEWSNKKKNRQATVERKAFKAYKDIIAYIEEASRKYLSVKKAIPRMHIFGSRFHWSFRGVIVPIVGAHQYYELHMPWQMAVNSLRVQILGVLMRDHGMSINTATAKVRRALMIVDDDIKQILDKMIEDSPFPGLPCLWDRPPSIRDGSVMLKFVTVIKTDLEDACVGMTPIDVSLPNADFDGDNLAGIFLFETEMVKTMRNLSPAALIYDRNNGGITSEIGIHKTTSITWNSFLGEV